MYIHYYMVKNVGHAVSKSREGVSILLFNGKIMEKSLKNVDAFGENTDY